LRGRGGHRLRRHGRDRALGRDGRRAGDHGHDALDAGRPALRLGLDCINNSGGAFATINASLKIAGPLTLALGVRWNGTSQSAGAPLFGLNISNAVSSSSAWRLNFSGAGTVRLTSAGGGSTGGLAALAAGVDSVVVVAVDSSGNVTA